MDEKVEALSYLVWTIPRAHTIGQNLRIPIPESNQKKDSVFHVRINYTTTEHSGGIQWFEPNQTVGKKKIFYLMF
jgi:hypothetical protein